MMNRHSIVWLGGSDRLSLQAGGGGGDQDSHNSLVRYLCVVLASCFVGIRALGALVSNREASCPLS